MKYNPIGIFDSGYGGLTILREIHRSLPQFDYLYLGDNARAPYGVRSFDVVYRFTLEAVERLFGMGCNLVILACNTASAKALRSIQQNDLPRIWEREGSSLKRVLGVIIPSVEQLGPLSRSRHVGVLATQGTVASHSYRIETAKLHPDITVEEEACPMWVPLVEYGEAESEGADFFVKRHVDSLLDRDPKIDTLLLGCTHYPILLPKIRKFTPEGINIVTQGEIVAESLSQYLRRHLEMTRECSRGGTVKYLTTERADKFSDMATVFMGAPVEAERITL